MNRKLCNYKDRLVLWVTACEICLQGLYALGSLLRGNRNAQLRFTEAKGAILKNNLQVFQFELWYYLDLISDSGIGAFCVVFFFMIVGFDTLYIRRSEYIGSDYGYLVERCDG